MPAARALYKFSWGSTFLLHKLVPVMLSSVGADTFKRFSSTDCVAAASTSHEEIREEAYLWSKQARNVSQGDTVNGALARGLNYQALGNARDAWCLVNRHYSAHCNDKCTGEFSNKLADAKDVMAAIHNVESARFPVLTPNLKGFEAAVAAGAKEVAIFASASESFSTSNINCTIEDSLTRYRDVVLAASKLSIPVRGYISCVVGCPVEGAVPPTKVAYVARELYDMGCSEISLGDTIGVGTPGTVIPMLEAVLGVVPVDKLAVHFHDTYGQALSNILASLQVGISTVDSSVSGLGGCPYAVGASGNVATEDVVYMLNGLGVKTNVDLGKLMLAGDFISKHLGRPSGSKTAVALSKLTAHASKL
ncbi:hydroxymethylglutaryl-CoA lyase, mitochondrial-like isoform X2 [Alnus glutinosa]|uniref:hydroxymethylglutaryl-CoA lyase, mitochondrial-like isoform X2 n=1 Tax=Alnus glutinosa TaxID=3517 RepID=UPI002D7693A1|nr:hydroxymethylglutaryl-CoA lyase, mitochondrial-like isoform X2 [Alnus glutinosa]